MFHPGHVFFFFFVLGVLHCGYYGAVGFVVCPHSVLSFGCSLWILWCRVCGMSPLCVVLGVLHCRYYGAVGFVVCPHSVLSLGCCTVDIMVL